MPVADTQPGGVAGVDVFPLSEWMRGTLTVVLESGGVFRTTTTARLATTLRQILAEQRGSDVIRWSESWLNVDPSKVALVEWEASPDYGWVMSAGIRQAQQDHGHHHGVVVTLVDHYGTGPEPAFSIDAMVVLSEAAAQLPPVDLIRYAELLQGIDGAQEAAGILTNTNRRLYRSAADRSAASDIRVSTDKATDNEAADDNLATDEQRTDTDSDDDQPDGNETGPGHDEAGS